MLLSKNKKGPVVLISKEICFTFPFGYAYLAGYLKENGEKVIIEYRPESSHHYKEFVQKIMKMDPLLVGIGTIYPDLYHARDIIKIFDQEERQFPIVIGGQMVSPTPEFSVEVTGADYGIVGEGEIILYDLVKSLRNNEIPLQLKGLVVQEEKKITFTGSGDYIEDMSRLPEIPYEMFPEDKWLNIGKFYANYADYFFAPMYRYDDRIVPIHGGRGCPYKCNFCYHHSNPRYKPISQMMEEAEKLLIRFNANMIEFNDDLVIATPRRAKELVDGMKELNIRMKRQIEYSISCRFNVLWNMDDEILKGLKGSGCRIMGLGLESGSQRILDIMHKKITVEQIITGLKRLKDAGIIPITAFMVGQYTETREDVEESIKLLKELIRNDKYFVAQFTITTPYPGSELYDIAFQKGLIKSHHDFFNKYNPNRDISGVSVNLSNMNDKELEMFRNKMENIYLNEKMKVADPKVVKIEKLRGTIIRTFNMIEKIVSIGIPNYAIFCIIKKNIDKINDFIQIRLDKKRLKLMDL